MLDATGRFISTPGSGSDRIPNPPRQLQQLFTALQRICGN
jgi:hypothetical protein